MPGRVSEQHQWGNRVSISVLLDSLVDWCISDIMVVPETIFGVVTPQMFEQVLGCLEVHFSRQCIELGKLCDGKMQGKPSVH